MLIDPEASEFVERESLKDELDWVLELARKNFPGSRRIEVALVECLDEEDGQPHLVLRIASDLPHRDFREATSRFFAPLRFSGKRIYMLLAVLQRG